MGFSWVTFCAQIVNLFVLMWLLKKFLYKPVLTAVEKRRQDIARQIEDARAASRAAAAEKEALSRERAAFSAQKNALLDAAAREAARIKDTLAADARDEINAEKARAQQALNRHVAEAGSALRDFMVQSFLHLSNDIIAKLCDTDTAKRATEVFLNQIRALPADEKKRLKNAIESAPSVTLAVAQPLSKTEKAAFLNSLKLALDTDAIPNVKWQNDPTLLAGAELNAGGITVSWHLKASVESFETRLKNQMATLLVKE